MQDELEKAADSGGSLRIENPTGHIKEIIVKKALGQHKKLSIWSK
jgi:hypothetical protein